MLPFKFSTHDELLGKYFALDVTNTHIRFKASTNRKLFGGHLAVNNHCIHQ